MPVVTAIGAVVAALAWLGARRVAMATPYSARVNALAEAFLKGSGIDVVSSAGLGIHDTADIGFVDEETVFRVARGAARADADALFLSCTNLPTVSVIPAAADRCGRENRPVRQADGYGIEGSIGGHGAPRSAVDSRRRAMCHVDPGAPHSTGLVR